MNLIPNPWVAMGFVVALGAASALSYVEGEQRGAERVQSAWDRAELSAGKARAARVEEVRKAQESLQTADEQRRKENAEVNAKRDLALAAAVRELRNRPARPGGADVPAPAGPGSQGWGTGAKLYRDDAEFLVGRADAAQRIRDQRDACYASYEQAAKTIDVLNAQRPK